MPDCWLQVSTRKVLRPATSTQVFLGFPVSISKCWDGSKDCSCVYCCSCFVCIVVVVLCVLLSSYVYLLYYVCIAVFTLDAGLLARSQYSEGPATGHLDTGFSWFPCVYKQTLRRFPTFQVATTCFSCSPPDLNLAVIRLILHNLYACKITTATGWQTNCSYYYYYYY